MSDPVTGVLASEVMVAFQIKVGKCTKVVVQNTLLRPPTEIGTWLEKIDCTNLLFTRYTPFLFYQLQRSPFSPLQPEHMPFESSIRRKALILARQTWQKAPG